MIEPELCRMDLFGKVFVRRLIDHEMTTRRDEPPKLTDVGIPRPGDMFNNGIGQYEPELSI